MGNTKKYCQSEPIIKNMTLAKVDSSLTANELKLSHNSKRVSQRKALMYDPVRGTSAELIATHLKS